MKDIWPDWVLDVSFSPRLPPCFCPYEQDTGNEFDPHEAARDEK